MATLVSITFMVLTCSLGFGKKLSLKCSHYLMHNCNNNNNNNNKTHQQNSNVLENKLISV